MRKRFGSSLGAVGIGAIAFTMITAAAVAQELSERSVKTIMNYAWAYTPENFTPPNGKTVRIDKSQRAEMTVSVAKGREVIQVARLTAHAQICDLREDQINNYRSLMTREQQSKKWTPQQLVYINQLHLTTLMMLVGKLQIVEHKDGKRVVVKEGKSTAKTCTAEQRKQVKALIARYVASGPKIAAAQSRTKKE
ncbi:MAG: hypothetical protein ACR2PG_18330 [Hyphomicrobiaceae bacterium]